MTDFLTADSNLPSYMMFPRFLLDMEINETAKMLYIILLDRARLSQKNEGWSDTDGHVFIYFTIEALAEVLHKEIKKNNLAIRGSKEPLSPYGKFQNVFLSEKELEDIRHRPFRNGQKNHCSGPERGWSCARSRGRRWHTRTAGPPFSFKYFNIV